MTVTLANYYNCSIIILTLKVFILQLLKLLSVVDQLNSTTHGTMLKTPYELVFGQPPRQSVFPGVDSVRICEEDIDDIVEEEQNGISQTSEEEVNRKEVNEHRQELEKQRLIEVEHKRELEEHEEEYRRGLEEEQRLLEEEERLIEEEQRLLEEEQRLLEGNHTRELNAEEHRRKQDGEHRPKQDEEHKRKQDEEQRRKQDEEQRRKQVEEQRRKQVEEQRWKQDEEQRRKQVEEQRRKQVEEHRWKQDEDSESDEERMQKNEVESEDDFSTDARCLGTSSKHLLVRKEADERYRQNVERMKMKYSKDKRKKMVTFCCGDFVSVKIPRIDRASTDLHRLPCVVVQVLGKKHHLYRLK